MPNDGTNFSQVEWQSAVFATRHRYDEWTGILNRIYGSWDMARKATGNYSASLTTKIFGPVSITCCTCEPCAGHRTRTNISRDDSETLAIQLTLGGLEHITFADKKYTIRAGDIFVWDSTREMRFQVEKTLRKISVQLPLQRLKDWMPRSWHSIPRKISSGSARGLLINSHVLSMAKKEFSGSGINGDALSEAIIALLVSATKQQLPESRPTLREKQLKQVKGFIEKNLDNPNLSLTDIASANGISLRYLHWLFESTDKTASQYIIEQRLMRCRQDLLNPLMTGRTVTEIAYSWGFNDPAHFSRRFKEAYGRSPNQSRHEILLT